MAFFECFVCMTRLLNAYAVCNNMAVLLSAMTIAIGLYEYSFSALAILCGVSVSVNRASSLTHAENRKFQM